MNDADYLDDQHYFELDEELVDEDFVDEDFVDEDFVDEDFEVDHHFKDK